MLLCILSGPRFGAGTRISSFRPRKVPALRRPRQSSVDFSLVRVVVDEVAARADLAAHQKLRHLAGEARVLDLHPPL